MTDEAKKAFEKLKHIITTTPIVLSFPQWDKPFEIHCDASKTAIAATLNQIIDGSERVVMRFTYINRKREEVPDLQT